MSEQFTTKEAQEKCPNCGKYVVFSEYAEGFFDREHREDELSILMIFCDEACADRYHQKRAEGRR